MAVDKYLNLAGLEEVADKVNEKLKKVSTMPASPSDGDMVLYVGVTTSDYINGIIYAYDGAQSKWVSKGGTSVILNGADKTGDEADFYAPTASGNEGQVLISQGVDEAPTWGSFSGYAPQFIDDSLCFYYGILPEVENTSLIFDLDNM